MATNPMQRKARNSFLLGVVVTLILAGLVVGFLIIQLKNYRDKEAQELANSTNVYVLKQDVRSGEIITPDMLEKQVTNKMYVPSNAIGNIDILTNYSLTDKAGNEITTEFRNNEATLYITKNGNKQELKIEEDTGNYYTESNGDKDYVELAESPLIAKVDLYKNTVITIDLISKSDEQTTNDLRNVEYNMFVLPSQLESGEYIDVRLSLPSGQDYIVVSKKQVDIPEIDGIYSTDTITMKLTEGEIIAMNNAIVEAYRILGSQLKVVTYTEAGIQDAATPTYVPTQAVMQLIESNPNIISTAKNALISRYNNNNALVRDGAINAAINNSGEEGEENLQTKVEESITNSKETRRQYLESLTGDIQ